MYSFVLGSLFIASTKYRKTHVNKKGFVLPQCFRDFSRWSLDSVAPGPLCDDAEDRGGKHVWEQTGWAHPDRGQRLGERKEKLNYHKHKQVDTNVSTSPWCPTCVTSDLCRQGNWSGNSRKDMRFLKIWLTSLFSFSLFWNYGFWYILCLMLCFLGVWGGKGVKRVHSSDHCDLVSIRLSSLNGDTESLQRLSGPRELTVTGRENGS